MTSARGVEARRRTVAAIKARDPDHYRRIGRMAGPSGGTKLSDRMPPEQPGDIPPGLKQRWNATLQRWFG
jgi:hypothetical protein